MTVAVARFAGPLAAALFAVVAACDSATQPACDCDDPTITINVPADVADEATLRVSGPACEGARPVCSNQTNGCAQYRFDAPAEGTCHIEVDFASGQVFTDDIPIVAANDACCVGFFASPLSAATVDVPAPDAG